jgi:hypothetical protein
LGLPPGDLILFSAKSGLGRNELWQAIEARIDVGGASLQDHAGRSDNG